MSHYTVTVRVTPARLARHSGNVERAIKEMLEPFYEGSGDERFIEFRDEEDRHREKYATESIEMIRLPDGELAHTHDDRFRVPGTFGFCSDGSSHRPPADLERVQSYHHERYPTFEAFMKDYCGYAAPDPKTGRYGYWRNPNAKWDWWAIGGRWTGFYPLKTGAPRRVGKRGVFGDPPKKTHGDAVRIADIDFDVVNRQQAERATTFHKEYLELLAGKKFPAFEGPREEAMSLGLCRVERQPVAQKDGERVISWETNVAPTDERRHWSDVLVEIDESTLLRDYAHCFNPIATYAGLDDDGWTAPGSMGWFGCSDDEPEAYVKWKRDFHDRFIAAAGPDDLLVVVDCHI